MSDYDPGAARASDLRELAAQVERIETALSTMAAWLVQAQTGFGAQDARGIDRILRGDANQERDRDDSNRGVDSPASSLHPYEADGLEPSETSANPASEQEER